MVYILSALIGLVFLAIAVSVWGRGLHANAIQILVIALFFLAIAIKKI